MLEIRVLGSPQFSLSGQSVTALRAAKSQALLVYLALTKRPFSRTALGDLLWPNHGEKEMRVSLRQSIYLIHKAIPGALLAQRETVAISPEIAVTIDVVGFETAVSTGTVEGLETAVSRYQGDLMAGFYVEDAYPFEEWLLLERERLRTLAMQALHDLVTHFVRRRQANKGVRYARQLLRLEPWIEEGHRALMRLLAWQGQYSAALKQYATCRKLLADELGVDPAPETAALFNRIRQLRTARRPALPQDSFPLVGRANEKTALNQMLHEPLNAGASNGRLVTLTGPGGMGKTRLMLAVAQQQTNLFLDGVYWVDLAEVKTCDGLVSAVMTQLQLQMSSSVPPDKQLINYLRGKELLLLLDNFEQLITDRTSLSFISKLLQTAPDVVLMITSRVRLNLQQEQVYRLDSLPYPTTETPAEESITDYPAVALFAETARWGRPDWQLVGNRETETAVVRICQLVEGLPLGLKMAAALTQAQSCPAIVDALSHNLDWLASDMADLPPRQRSLRATFDYSLQLLPDRERDLFLQLSLFRGGFTREAVQAIVTTSDTGGKTTRQTAIPRLLARLVSHSLLNYRSDRYTIHAVVRQFAAEMREFATKERKTAVGDTTLSQRYAAYYLAFLAQRQASLQGESPQMAAAEIDDEIENVRHAWWLGLTQQQFDLVLEAVHAFSTYFQLNGRSYEAERLFNIAIQKVEPFAANDGTAARLLAWVLLEQGRFFIRLSEYKTAIGVVERAIAGAKQGQDEEAEGMAYILWGEALWRQGEYAAAEAKLNRALSIANRHALTLLFGWGNHHLGIICDIQANYAKAVEHLEIACDAWNSLQYPQALGVSLNSMGLVAYHQGNFAHAKQAMEEALTISQRLGNRQFEPHLLNNLSIMATDQGDYASAKRYLQQALQLANISGDLYLEGNVHLNLGVNAQHAHDLESATTYLERSLQIVESIGDFDSIARAKLSLAEVLSEQSVPKRAEILFNQSLEIARQIGARFTECRNLIGLALLLENTNREQAIEYAYEALPLVKALQHPSLVEPAQKVNALLEIDETKLQQKKPAS
ncbi:MAG: tetratricopeptide repeat protein [Chloroflexota bacterium]